MEVTSRRNDVRASLLGLHPDTALCCPSRHLVILAWVDAWGR